MSGSSPLSLLGCGLWSRWVRSSYLEHEETRRVEGDFRACRVMIHVPLAHSSGAVLILDIRSKFFRRLQSYIHVTPAIRTSREGAVVKTFDILHFGALRQRLDDLRGGPNSLLPTPVVNLYEPVALKNGFPWEIFDMKFVQRLCARHNFPCGKAVALLPYEVVIEVRRQQPHNINGTKLVDALQNIPRIEGVPDKHLGRDIPGENVKKKRVQRRALTACILREAVLCSPRRRR